MNTPRQRQPHASRGLPLAALALTLLTALGLLQAPTAQAASGSSGAIEARYLALGGSLGVLGARSGDEQCGSRDGGCQRSYENGIIVWTTTTGAHGVHGSVLDTWRGTGSENGPLGYPVTELSCTLDHGGCYQRFQYGSVVSGSVWGTHGIKGAIGAKWNETGQTRGYLGFPVSDELCGMIHGGCLQSFGSGRIAWSPATGAHAVHHEINSRWESEGDVDGSLGYPVSEQEITDGTIVQHFQGGAIVYTAANSSFVVGGSVYEAWTSAGGLGGDYGAPTGGAHCTSTGCTQTFERGTISA